MNLKRVALSGVLGLAWGGLCVVGGIPSLIALLGAFGIGFFLTDIIADNLGIE